LKDKAFSNIWYILKTELTFHLSKGLSKFRVFMNIPSILFTLPTFQLLRV